MKRQNFVPLTPGGAGSLWGGWTKPLEQQVEQLEAEIAGLEARVKTPTRPGVPAVYRAAREFVPEFGNAFLFDTEQDGVSSNLVNYVMRDANTYNIPVIFPGPGVFTAKQIKVSIYQRLFKPQFSEPTQLHYTTSLIGLFSSVGPIFPFTPKFSLYPKQPISAPFSPRFNAINFVWNLLDSRSQRYLSSDLMSHEFLLPRSPGPFNAVAPGSTQQLPDGGYFQLHAPWVFERDSQVQFQFRPITPVLQFDSSISGLNPAVGLLYDDRENGVRNQTVTVGIELLGYRYVADQDMAEAGTLTRPTR